MEASANAIGGQVRKRELRLEELVERNSLVIFSAKFLGFPNKV
ncbi:hypothetical protein CBU02nite_23890 [Clostridium butyricum]|uniref:Uncharacterized protein n=1 Tax=Clostridium butyricum TaxID=1492 RepID=A0A512TP27_CLOBU|nr:hypothetical protein CBU02nite_23890 [Clostridium butyricum]